MRRDRSRWRRSTRASRCVRSTSTGGPSTRTTSSCSTRSTASPWSSRRRSIRATPPPPFIRFTVPKGITSLLIRKIGEVERKGGEVELVRVRYRTAREELWDAIHQAKCQADDRVHGTGILAWLPNRDYEITARVRITLDHQRSGAQTAEVEQKAFFRTKGLPGLNAVPRVGDEVEPYVESRYPGPGAAPVPPGTARRRIHRTVQHPRPGGPERLARRRGEPDPRMGPGRREDRRRHRLRTGHEDRRGLGRAPSWSTGASATAPAPDTDRRDLHHRRTHGTLPRSADRPVRGDDGPARRLPEPGRWAASLTGPDPCPGRPRGARRRGAALGARRGAPRQPAPEGRAVRRTRRVRGRGRVSVHRDQRQWRRRRLALRRRADAPGRRSVAGRRALRGLRRRRLAAPADRGRRRPRRAAKPASPSPSSARTASRHCCRRRASSG